MKKDWTHSVDHSKSTNWCRGLVRVSDLTSKATPITSALLLCAGVGFGQTRCTLLFFPDVNFFPAMSRLTSKRISVC